MTPMSPAEGMELVKFLLFWIPLFLGLFVAFVAHHKAMAATFCLMLWTAPWAVIFGVTTEAIQKRQWFMISLLFPATVAFTVFLVLGLKGVSEGTFWNPFFKAIRWMVSYVEHSRLMTKHEQKLALGSIRSDWQKEDTGPDYPARHS